MKTAKLLFTLILIVMVFASLCASAGAMDSGFILEEYPEEHIQTYLSNIDIQLIDEEPKKGRVMCYAVRDDGTFAVGSQIAETEYVSVFDKNGKFQYGYKFKMSGDFYAEWDGSGELIIINYRADIATLFDGNGNCTDVKYLAFSPENDEYWKVVRNEFQKVGDDTYRMHNGKLTKTDAEGNESVLYNASESHITFYVILMVLCFGFFAAIGFRIYSDAKDNIEEQKKNSKQE